MKISDKMEQCLVERMLWPDEAKAVVEASRQKQDGIRWSDDESCYPPAMMAVLAIRVKADAVDYLKANMPKHFAIEVLEAELPKKEAGAKSL